MRSSPVVLVVDDDPVNVRLLEAHLKSEGYIVRAAYDGEEALRAVQEETPDLILLDIMMPRLDGFEVCRRIKFNPETAFIPIIMVTALSDFDSYLKGLEVGADDFLVKPVNYLELKARTRSLLRIKKLTDEREAQTRVMSLLINVLPLLIKSVPEDVRNHFISEISRGISETYMPKYRGGRTVSDVVTFINDVLTEMGADISVEETSDDFVLVQITKCPWGEDRDNPAMCLLCRAIYLRLTTDVLLNAVVDLERTYMDEHEPCIIKVQTY